MCEKQGGAQQTEHAGFTLIEVLTVVLIIAVLVAIAVPVFLGVRRRADDRAAQSTARLALVSAKTLFQTDEDYTAATPASLGDVETSINFVDASTPSTTQQVVSVDPTDPFIWIGAVFSRTGTCFWIRDEAVAGSGGTTYGRLDVASSGCRADQAGAVVFASGW